ncbi:CGNR zinc finger domain-containing protein [Brevibacterium atlanticum]|uniref:CGNR zinc finger domain-containing protein n=1 Tax=Brevibacterium atlanticum TaxID=2697563 RepID=UPI001AA0DA83|nr:CGNR zinc finger domain-containing protein [Brevibacterium atlanticum]
MEFEHVANALCLELSNSVPDRRESSERDWLRTPDGAKDWVQSLNLQLAEALGSEELDRLKRLRESVFETFAALSALTEVSERSLGVISAEHAAGLGRHGYTSRDGMVERDWPRRWDGESLIALFADSAITELTGSRLDRLKLCPGCHWLFFDMSRNRSRRWCSMQTCGGRDKALRHYRRTRA